MTHDAAWQAPRDGAGESRPLRRRAQRARRPAVSALVALLRWSGLVGGSIAIIVCLSVAGTFVAALCERGQDVRRALGAIFLSLAIGAVALAVLYASTRAYAAMVFAVTTIALITGGFAMLVAAPVVRQMNTPELVEYRGFTALLWFGLLALALGLALAAIVVCWSMHREARRRLARWARLGGASYGVWLALSGISGMLLMLTLINGEATTGDDGTEFSVVQQAIAFTAIAMWSLVPGVILTYHGISASMGEGSTGARLPMAAPAVAAFAGIVLLGHWNMSSDEPVAAPMPPLHVLAAALPGIALVAMAARGSPWRGWAVRGVTWRQLLLAAAFSMSVATTIAVYVESIGAVYTIVLMLVHHGAFADAATGSEVMEIIFEDADWILSEHEQFAANLIVAAVLAPVSEELAKSLSVRFTMAPNATRAQCFLLGAAAGAAFGFLEALLYGLAGIQDGLDGWWEIMLVRGGSTSLHVICTGLAGLAWWYWTRARRHRLSAALFAGAMLIHAGWNGIFTAIDARIFVLDTISNRTLEIVAYAIVAVVSASMIAAVPVIARGLREAAPPVEGTPLAAMAPWLA